MKYFEIKINDYFYRGLEESDGQRHIAKRDLLFNMPSGTISQTVGRMFRNAVHIDRRGAHFIPARDAMLIARKFIHEHCQWNLFVNGEKDIIIDPRENRRRAEKKPVYPPEFWDELTKDGENVVLNFLVAPVHAATELSNRGYDRIGYQDGEPVWRKVSRTRVILKSRSEEIPDSMIVAALNRCERVFLWRDFLNNISAHPPKLQSLSIIENLGIEKGRSYWWKPARGENLKKDFQALVLEGKIDYHEAREILIWLRNDKQWFKQNDKLKVIKNMIDNIL